MDNKIKFFGLLHVKDNENKKLNFNSKDQTEKIVVYLKMLFCLISNLKIIITN